MRKAITLARNASVHDGLPSRLNNLAQMLKETGKTAEAEPLFREALSLSEKLYGPQDRRVAECLHNLSALLFAQRRYRDAEGLLRQAIAIEDKILPADHPNRAIRLAALARLANLGGQTAEARSLTLNALKIAEDCFGSESPQLLPFLYASIDIAEDADTARKLRARVLAISPFGGQHRFEQSLGAWLGCVQTLIESAANSEEAQAFIRMALNATRCPDPVSAEVFLHCRACLAILLVDLGMPLDGMSVLNTTKREADSAGYRLTLNYANGLSTAAHRLRQIDMDAEAVELFQQVCAIQENHWGAIDQMHLAA